MNDSSRSVTFQPATEYSGNVLIWVRMHSMGECGVRSDKAPLCRSHQTQWMFGCWRSWMWPWLSGKQLLISTAVFHCAEESRVYRPLITVTLWELTWKYLYTTDDVLSVRSSVQLLLARLQRAAVNVQHHRHSIWWTGLRSTHAGCRHVMLLCMMWRNQAVNVM